MDLIQKDTPDGERIDLVREIIYSLVHQGDIVLYETDLDLPDCRDQIVGFCPKNDAQETHGQGETPYQPGPG